MKLNLIIDGNYLLIKHVFTLQKHGEVYGHLHKFLMDTITDLANLYPFEKVYFVSDSKGNYWRKDIYPEYKGTREKTEEIDWEFVYTVYNEFKEEVRETKKQFRILETPKVEGDDWMAYLVKTSNLRGESNILVTNDGDIKQLLGYSTTEPIYLNIMANEMYGKNEVFLPENYQLFFNKAASGVEDGFFDESEDSKILKFLNNFISRRQETIVDPNKNLVVKLISGDKGDNIKTVYSKVGATGKARGIGVDGAKTLYEKYVEEYKESPNVKDPDFYDNMVDIIKEAKKLSSSELPAIKENMKFNMSLINLDHIPDWVNKKMEDQLNQVILSSAANPIEVIVPETPKLNQEDDFDTWLSDNSKPAVTATTKPVEKPKENKTEDFDFDAWINS